MRQTQSPETFQLDQLPSFTMDPEMGGERQESEAIVYGLNLESTPRPPKRFQRLRTVVAFGGAVLLGACGTLVVDNAAYTNELATGIIVDSTMASDIPGCQSVVADAPATELHDLENVEHGNKTELIRQQLEATYSGKVSAARKNNSLFNPIDNFVEYAHIARTPQTQPTFIMESTGVAVRVRAPTATVDPTVYEAMFLAVLESGDSIEHPLIKANLKCLKQKYLEERAFAGTVVDLIIPPNPRSCMRNGRLEETPINQPDSDFCLQDGFTPPTYPWRLFVLKHDNPLQMAAPGITDTKTADNKVQKVMSHELVHLAAQTIPSAQFKLDANEQEAQYLDDYITQLVRGLPPVYTYDQDALRRYLS